jgi:magnesium chelatase subunit D
VKGRSSKKTSTEMTPGNAGLLLRAFPFSAVVGQEEMKLALILNLIEPRIGGVLIMGHRGTGKSTIVRSLAQLLPLQKRVVDCLVGCDPDDMRSLCDQCRDQKAPDGRLPYQTKPAPVVTLPLGATEDRLCGSISIEDALKKGKKSFEPGLLAKAHRGFLYIDEVNLLEDHLVDVLLDVAASGENVVEREGISFRHPARFVLIGSGNPEEGELRPQLLDRFGLQVEVETLQDIEQRMEIVELRHEFENDPEGFVSRFGVSENEIGLRIINATNALPTVSLDRQLLRRIVVLCQELRIDGHRGELTISKAAAALAAFEGRSQVSDEDVRRVAGMCLRHRLRRDPLETGNDSVRINQKLDQLFPADSAVTSQSARNSSDSAPISGESAEIEGMNNTEPVADTSSSQSAPEVVPPTEKGRIEESSNSKNRPGHSTRRSKETVAGSGKSQMSRSSARGRYSGAVPKRDAASRVAVDVTLRVSLAGRADFSFKPTNVPTGIRAEDLRYKRFVRRAGKLYVLVVDTSGSMAMNRIGQVKGALSTLLQRSYINRDSVAIVSFRCSEASLVLAPSKSVLRAKMALETLPVGGATPLPLGLSKALEVVKRSAGNVNRRPVILLFTDGGANVPLSGSADLPRAEREKLIHAEVELLGQKCREAGAEITVVDTQSHHQFTGQAEVLAKRLQASLASLRNVDDRTWLNTNCGRIIKVG